MPSPIDPTNPPLISVHLDVVGALPVALVGRLVAMGGDGLVHSFQFGDGRVSYVARGVAMDVGVQGLAAFDGSVLVYGDDSSVQQLDVGTGTLRRVDLAGHLRSVIACPRVDQATGELHLVAVDRSGTQLHVVVPSGALTRRSRQVVGATARIRGLALGVEHVVFVADGSVAVAARDGELAEVWVPTGAPAPSPVHTHRIDDSVVLLVVTPLLERWVVHTTAGVVEREVLDPSPGGVLFVAAPQRSDPLDHGWLIGFVHHPSAPTAELRVCAASDVADVAAAAHVPHPLPRELRCTWIPAAPLSPPPQETS